jgi:hypothetical protein
MNDADPKTLFEDAVQGLDLATANRLRLARRAVLAGDARASRRAPWLPALAASCALVLGLAWWLPQRAATPTSAPPPVVAGADDEALDLAQDAEDTELYAWLGEAPVAADENKEQKL